MITQVESLLVLKQDVIVMRDVNTQQEGKIKEITN